MELCGVVCGDGGCGLVVFFKKECSGSEYITMQLHPVKRSQPLLLKWLSLQQQCPGFTLCFSRAHIRGLIGVHADGRDCAMVTLVRLINFAGQCIVACRQVLELETCKICGR